MKQVSIIRFIASLMLIVLTSTILSFLCTGDAAQLAIPIGTILFGIGCAMGIVKALTGKQFNMPGNLLYDALVINDTTYAGEAASYMITRAVVGADTIEKGCIYVEDGIKKQKTIPRIEVANFFQKRAATPVTKGTVTVDGAVVAPQDLMLYYEFNPRDYEQHWYAVEMNPKLLDAELPPTAENFMMMQTMKRTNEFFENAIWRSRKDYDPDGNNVDPTTVGGVAADADYLYFDGLIKKALDNANTLQVNSPVTLTGGASGNIIDKFQLAYNKVPSALLYKYGPLGLKYFISYKDQQKYEDTLQKLTTYKNQDTTEKGINRYNGYDVIPLAGLPENTFFVGIGKPDVDSNLWVGINSTEDAELKLEKLQANSELFFVKGLFKMDTQIGFADQLVMYTTQTA
jgi:hypothetical protein